MDATTPGDAHLLLLGFPPAAEFFRIVQTLLIESDERSIVSLTLAWRRASRRVQALQQLEPERARVSALRPLPQSMTEIAAACLMEPALSHAQQLYPRQWALVELDRLIVPQRHINLEWVSNLHEHLGGASSDADIVRLSAGANVPEPRVDLVRSDDGTYTFTCSSGELRFLGSRALDASLATSQAPTARITHLIGLMVGFGLQCMSAVHYGDRLLLTNGVHRAYVMRQLGLTHAPCLVASLTHEDELELVGAGESRARYERLLRLARPPLLADFFESGLCERLRLRRHSRALQLQTSSRMFRVPPHHG